MKKAYKVEKNQYTTIQRNESVEGRTIEQRVFQMLNSKEPIEETAPEIYTERKDGVKPEYDPRTDRFDVALEGMDYVTKSGLAKREERQKANEDAKIVKMEPKSEGSEGGGKVGD